MIYIIAEAGVNHGGSLKTAKGLVEAAAWAGADAVKFQTFSADAIALKNLDKAKYQIRAGESGESQHAMLKRLELKTHDYAILKDFAEDQNLDFLSSPFDLKSLELLLELGVDTIKIASGEITDFPLLRAIGHSKKKVILSTGMSTQTEVLDAIKVLERYGTEKQYLTVLHCTGEYPASLDDVNLLAMVYLKNATGCAVGYSDHTSGFIAPVCAAALGATVIEKHLTLNCASPGPDQLASLDPQSFRQMVELIRMAELVLGKGDRVPSIEELDNSAVVRKSIVAAKDIPTGKIIEEDDLTTKRAGYGLSPMNWPKVIGLKSPKDFKKDEVIVL